jgi:hypothetical protein
VPNPEILRSSHLKNYCAPFRMAMVFPLPREWNIFHSQCMQSMLPSISGNSRDSLIDNRQAVL